LQDENYSRAFRKVTGKGQVVQGGKKNKLGWRAQKAIRKNEKRGTSEKNKLSTRSTKGKMAVYNTGRE